MKKQLAFGLSAAVTTLVVATVWILAIPSDSGGTVNQAASTMVASQAPTLNQIEETERLNDVLLQREEVYRTELEKANRQLQSIRTSESYGDAYSRLDDDSDDDSSGHRVSAGPSRKAGLVSRDQASRIALVYVGGGQVREVEMEREGGSLVYDVKLQTGYGELEVYVDATTGEVHSSESD